MRARKKRPTAVGLFGMTDGYPHPWGICAVSGKLFLISGAQIHAVNGLRRGVDGVEQPVACNAEIAAVGAAAQLFKLAAVKPAGVYAGVIVDI